MRIMHVADGKVHFTMRNTKFRVENLGYQTCRVRHPAHRTAYGHLEVEVEPINLDV